jgi:disulfide bond formation protein DsbB
MNIAIRFFESRRAPFAAVAAACAGLLGYGYYLQYFAGQEPCPLCILQRLAFFAIAILAAAAAVHGPMHLGRLGYGAAMLVAAVIGGAIAGRQVWLQHLPPDKVPECGPGLDYLLDVFPPGEALRMIFTGSGECAEVGWTFLSLSIAEWSLIWFALFLAIAGWLCRGVVITADAGAVR